MATWSGSTTPVYQSPNSSPDIEKALQMMERKKAYNQWYYQQKTKPRKEQEKTILSSIPTIESLTQHVNQLQTENENLRAMLDAAVRKNNELMRINAVHILPPIGGYR
jgi:hypothetical protein